MVLLSVLDVYLLPGWLPFPDQVLPVMGLPARDTLVV
jgi:hypothetical protein